MAKIRIKKNPHSRAIGRRFEKLVDIMFTLRSEGGCPWDRSQSLRDLKQYLLEEAYELLEALDLERNDMMREELGDLLLQVVFQSQIMQERKTFTLLEVIDELINKLIGRHPHVFGDTKAGTPEEALESWESRKGKEKETRNQKRTVLQGVPLNLPALLQANIISSKVARVGFDWEKEEDVWKKLEEELDEFRDARTKRDREEELGDVLFTLVNIARKHKINPEDALRLANAKFRKRFNKLEERVHSEDKNMKQMNLNELDQIWNEIKKK